VAGLSVTVAGATLALRWNCTETLCHVTAGEGWVAFERRLDWFLPADTDTVVYLARSLEDRSSWRRLMPTDPGPVLSMEWKDARRLQIKMLSGASHLDRVDDVTIEWLR
jgi:hypothetical protein